MYIIQLTNYNSYIMHLPSHIYFHYNNIENNINYIFMLNC